MTPLIPALRRSLWLAACLAIALGLTVTPAAAQHISVSLGASGGVPQNDFGDQLDRIGYGLSGSVLYGFGPVAAGIEGGLLTYDRQAEPLQAQIDGRSAFLGDVQTTSAIGHLHAVLRFQLPMGAVRPYVDGLAGFQHFTTKTRFDQAVVLVSDPVIGVFPGAVDRSRTTTSVDAQDVALSYGVGGGLQVLLAEGVDDRTPFRAYLDLGARYLLGEEARYRLDATPTAGGEHTAVWLVQSRTDLLRPQLSLLIEFGR